MTTTNKALMVKEVDFNGDTLMAAQESKTQAIYVGVKWICKGIGLSEDQGRAQIKKVQSDIVLNRGCVKFDTGVFDPNNTTVALLIDFLPLWLAKISITPTMQRDNPKLVEKLIAYQLKAKDVLAAAFLGEKYTNINYIRPNYDFESFDFNGFFTGYINHIVNQSMQPYITNLHHGMSEIKDGFTRSHNELLNGQKMIYNSMRQNGNSVYSEYVASNEKDRIYDIVKEIIKLQPDKFTDVGKTLSYFYKELRDVYGFVPDQLQRDYTAKYNSDSKTPVIDLILENKTRTSVFKNMLADYLSGLQSNSKGYESNNSLDNDITRHVELEALTTHSNSSETDNEHHSPSLSPFEQLVAKRNDKSMNGSVTAKSVYKHMGMSKQNWSYYEKKHREKNGFSKKKIVTKMDIIRGSKKLTERFNVAVQEMFEQ